MTTAPDVAVIGGGILGCALAAFLAEAGATVVLLERDVIAAGASGRNSGIVQHPMDPVLLSLFTETLAHYRDLAAHGFSLPAEPQGLLLVAEDEAALAPELVAIRGGFPELAADALGPGEPARLEPALAPHLAGARLHTGYAVPPAAAAAAFAARAEAAGAQIRTGAAAVPARDGVAVDGVHVPAGAVVVAAGPWTPELIDPTGAWRPIAPLWGVNAEVRLEAPPRHALEEVGIEQLVAQTGDPPPLFSLVTAGTTSSLGSTFLPVEPDGAALAPVLRARGARFVPALAETPIVSVRACARPQSADGRPLLGRAPGRDDVFVAAGHGPWGISLGPASARLVADLVLGRGPSLPRAFDPARFASMADSAGA
jgi:D-hydroxyproline dehydrogenase subunit beta